MQLVEALASGIAGAPSGVAKFYAYARPVAYQVPLTVYDEDGNAIGTEVTLDAYGGADHVYVNVRADVLVETAAGDVVRRFSVLGGDGAHELENANFTGTDRVTGQQVQGGVVVERAAWERLYLSNGAPNGLVRMTGSSADQYLKDALAGLRNTNFPLFNVKDTAYGAIGDGTTPDDVAIQKCIDAAEVAGGIVFFPSGTYLLAAGLTCNSAKVSFLGVGAEGSKLKLSPVAPVALTISDGASVFCGAFVKGLSFDHASTGTNYAIQVVQSPGRIFEGIRVRGFLLGINLQTQCYLINCDVWTTNGSATGCVVLSGTAAGSVIYGGSYLQNTSAAPVILCGVTDVLVHGAVITTAGGAVDGYGFQTGSQRCRVQNCIFDKVTGATRDYPIRVTADVDFWEDGNFYKVSTFVGEFLGDAHTYTNIYRGSRLGRRTNSNSVTPNINVDKAYHYLNPTGNITMALPTNATPMAGTGSGRPTHGASVYITIFNGTGGAITTSFGGGGTVRATLGNLANTFFRQYHLTYNSQNDLWVQQGANADV